ncbi:MAG: bile acid:sodium symporter family protein [Woeseiaceae bacterium]
MSLQEFFNFALVVFTLSNIGALGLAINLRDATKTLVSLHAIGLILLWGWIIGPLVASLIIWLLPLSDAHAAGLLLISLAPTAPFFPLMVSMARGDMNFAGAFMMLSTVGVVLGVPLLAPLLITGLSVDAWSLARPMLVLVLSPILVGSAIRFFAPNVATKLLPVVQKIGGLFLVIGLGLTLWIYGRDMLSLVGSFAPGAQVLFFIVMTTLSYTIHFGLTQPQRSAMALGMCTRNIAAVFAAYFGIINPPDGLFVMVALVIPLAAIVAVGAARLFARWAPAAAEEGGTG